MMTIAERLGASAFYDYVTRFGYLEKTGIDLPSEASSIFHKPQNIGTTELATASFGQRFKVSVIRQLTSVCAVANEGRLVTPYLVQRVIDSDGNVISEHETEIKRQVVSKEVADTVANILEEGVSGDGGAKNAAVSGYKVAAKTGTSQKFDVLDANGNSYLRISSTVAFSISEENDIAVIIVVDEPTSFVKYGSVVAAPYVSAFLTKALPYLGYERIGEDNTVTVDSFVGKSVSEASAAIKKLGIKYEIIGNGDTVIAQTPNPTEEITSNGKILLYTDGSQTEYIIVPDVRGMEASEANKILTDLGLNIKFSGITENIGGATVTAQSINSGAVVPRNTVIEISVIHLDFED